MASDKRAGLLPADRQFNSIGQVLGDAPPDFWWPVIQHLRARHNLPDDDWQRLPNGKNAVFAVGEGIIVKLIPPFWSEDAQHEIAALQTADRISGLECPHLLATDEVDDWTVILTARLDGTNLSKIWRTLPVNQQISLARQVGVIAAQLHALPSLFPDSLQIDWSELLEAQVADSDGQLRHENAPPHLIESWPAFLKLAGPFPLSQSPTVFLHGDLSAGNFMAHERDGQWQITGLLDFGDASVGPFEHDLLSPNFNTFRGDRALLQAFYEGYGLRLDRRTNQLAQHLMARTVLWYGWAELSPKLLPTALNSWPQIASAFWHLSA